MARTNSKPKETKAFTAEGGRAYSHLRHADALRRSVMSCMLWEDEFYEDGVSIANRISELAAKVDPHALALLAIEARNRYHLRHVPLWLLVTLAKTGSGTPLLSSTIPKVIRRADEISELAALYWKANPDKMLSMQMNKGLAAAFDNFEEYHFAKYDRDATVKLRDVMRLVRPKPGNSERAALYKRLNERTLNTPDTWEVELSAGADKKATFERLIRERKLGYLALLRNLRNMIRAECDRELVHEAILERRGASRVLPFRYIAAAKAAPEFEPWIDEAMIAGLAQLPKLPGKTICLIDVSGSMYSAGNISAKSDMTRVQAACALAAIARELCEMPAIYATAGSDSTRKHQTKLVPARRGMALADAIHGMCRPLGGGGIFLTQAIDFVKQHEKAADRIIVITDEQDCDISSKGRADLAVPFGTAGNYLINVASNKNGIGYGPKWTHIDGMSEAVFDFVREVESDNNL
jgi:60 kDa SS-A/Ro ribonucleoprotein